MTTTRRHRLCAAALAALAALGAVPAFAAGDAAERSRIDRERQQAMARFSAEEAVCRERFSVTACVDEARARRRAALSSLRMQEVLLDDAERKRRAAARTQAIEAKRIEAESRPPAPPQPSPAVRPVPAERGSAPAFEVRRPRHDDEADAAARRAAAAERGRADAAAEQAKIAARASDAATKDKKKSAALPIPPEYAASAGRR